MILLASGSTHLWTLDLAPQAQRWAQLAHTLSADERMRSDRFAFALPRRRFVTGRMLLRSVLAAYLAAPPEELAFQYGPEGKPLLAAPWAASGLEFNLSHCGDRMVMAVTRDGPVGVDIEQIRKVPEMLRITELYLPPADRRSLAAAPPEERDALFFGAWTRMEALGKAVGVGLTQAVPAEGFQVVSWSPGPGYVATVAIQGKTLFMHMPASVLEMQA